MRTITLTDPTEPWELDPPSATPEIFDLDEPPNTKPIDIDECESTSIRVSCYRETSRLTRMVDTFQLAMSYAHLDGDRHQISGKIVELHDHKGNLTVTWASQPSEKQKGYIQKAWEAQCECCIEHEWTDRLGRSRKA